jgi:hypothetical protein
MQNNPRQKVRKLEPPACWTGQPNAMQRLNATKKHEDKEKPLTKNKDKLENVLDRKADCNSINEKLAAAQAIG